VSQSQQEPTGVWITLFKYVAAPVIVAVAVALLLAALHLGKDGAPGTGETSTPKNGRAVERPAEEVNRTVNFADFVVTIRSLQCGISEFNTYKARGEFCVLRAKVDNRGKVATSVSRLWTLYVGENRFPMTSALGPGFNSLFPDEGGEGEIAFDVPIGDSPTKVVLGVFSDSPSMPLP
jgi:hypothetical protein